MVVNGVLATITLSILIGLAFSLLASLIVYRISRKKFFQEAFNILDQVQLPEKPRSKGELRRYKKLRSMVSSAKRRLMILFIFHIFVFTTSYMLMITTLLLILKSTDMIEIPIPIPLLTAKTDDTFYTRPFFLAFLAYLTPLYLFIRAVRPVREE